MAPVAADTSEFITVSKTAKVAMTAVVAVVTCRARCRPRSALSGSHHGGTR
ncbi:Uncharacterised protein [Mycobacteroides abscessus subsp. abscessus]|nr:Uncharacterised protein [Mycobacteroides abscessus subsp. abscessus]